MTKQNIFSLSFLCILIATSLSSCSSSSSFYSVAGINEGKEIVKTNFKAKSDGDKIIQVKFEQERPLSDILGEVSVMYVKNDNSIYTLEKYLNVDGDAKLGNNYGVSELADYANIQSLEISSINSEEIHKLIEKAINQIPEGYSFKAVKDIIVGVNVDIKPEVRYKIDKTFEKLDNKQKVQFTIQVTEDGNSTSRRGKMITTNYYEIKCEVENDGSVTLKMD